MGGAGFILAINLFVAGLIASAFLLISLSDRSYVSARWFALAYAIGMLNMGVEFVIPLLQDYQPVLVTLAFAALVAAMGVFDLGLARMYSVRAPVRLMAGILVISTVVQMATQDTMARDSILRMMLYQAPFFLMQAVAAFLVASAPAKGRLDQALVGLLALSALHFLAKPFLALAAGGMGDSPQSYISTTYALLSQSLGTVFSIAVALLVFVILVRELLDEITEKSRTDSLSGLLNRGGFTERLDRILAGNSRGKPPVSLILCDLDHFKTVNDTYGHASGDRVITAFAGILREAAGEDYAIGRIGGEEFAIVLPGCNLTAARLFAENARAAFAGLPIEGMPAHVRFSASFGVAELSGGETATEAMARADMALYWAKASGRDCVRVSPNETASPRRFTRSD
ncbi:MAG TPA: GGDEF domain-containing protein [Rhizobiaceae bacterium]|nr:GGDEF domain-containing protein [Rhizobiaceae bacterium]